MSKTYITSVKGEKIVLPQELIEFYHKRGIFIPRLPSYEQVQGRGANEPPKCDFDEKGDYFVFTASVENEERKDRIDALKKAKLVGKYLFGENCLPNIEVVSRSYMLNGGTKPIRLEFLISGKKEQVAYVKKPDLLRVLGKDLYNHLSGNNPLEFRFNEYAFVVKEVKGQPLTHRNKHYVVNDQRFIDNLIRLSTMDHFISINDLACVGSQRNILVSDNCYIAVIDFDGLFLPNPSQITTLEYYQHAFGVKLIASHIKEVVQDEKMRIKKRFEKNHIYLEKLIKTMSKIKPLNDRVKEIYGDKTVSHYFFERKLKELSR